MHKSIKDYFLLIINDKHIYHRCIYIYFNFYRRHFNNIILYERKECRLFKIKLFYFFIKIYIDTTSFIVGKITQSNFRNLNYKLSSHYRMLVITILEKRLPETQNELEEIV